VRPLRVREADLESTRSIRRLCARVADLLGRGAVSPQRATAIMLAIKMSTSMSELEMAEQAISEATRLRSERLQKPRLISHAPVIDADVVEVKP
jgi:hypothetical protein